LFGSNVNALALVARHPEQVRTRILRALGIHR
jgi:hypothetical protein